MKRRCEMQNGTHVNSKGDETGKSGRRRYGGRRGWNPPPEVHPTCRPYFSIVQKIKATATSTYCLDLPTVCVDAQLANRLIREG